MWRAGFGPAVEQLSDLSNYSPKQFYKALVKASDKKPDYIDVADDYLKGLVMGLEEAGRQHLIREAGDLLYHLFVMLAARDVALGEVEAELAKRFGISGLDEKASRPPKA